MRLCRVSLAEAVPAVIGQIDTRIWAPGCDGGWRLGAEGILPGAANLCLDLGKADAAERRRRAAQAAMDDIVVEPDGVEEMRAA